MNARMFDDAATFFRDATIIPRDAATIFHNAT